MLRADFGVGILLASLDWKLQERTVISFFTLKFTAFKDGLETCDTQMKNILQETTLNTLFHLLYNHLSISYP